jgi:predicted membrane protein
MNTRSVIAGILILIGVLLLFDNIFGVSLGGIISDWWPLVLIVMGIVSLSKDSGSIFSGIVLIIIGVVLQAWKLDFIYGSFWSIIWPLALILIGVSLFTHSRGRKDKILSDDVIEIATIFGGSNERIHSNNFQGGSCTAIFGGSTIDLRDSKISLNGANLEMTAAFGGIELIVPENIRIQTTGTPILGALDNKARTVSDINDVAPLLKINYFVMFGGIEIKNHK